MGFFKYRDVSKYDLEQTLVSIVENIKLKVPKVGLCERIKSWKLSVSLSIYKLMLEVYNLK